MKLLRVHVIAAQTCGGLLDGIDIRDLKLENIFYLNTVFHFFDRLEFDDDLRLQDVALDLAALWVDLRAWEQKTAANDLISVYESRSMDPGIRTVLPYFICLRALLNGYVIAAGQHVHPRWSLAPETYLKIASDVSDLQWSRTGAAAHRILCHQPSMSHVPRRGSNHIRSLRNMPRTGTNAAYVRTDDRYFAGCL